MTENHQQQLLQQLREAGLPSEYNYIAIALACQERRAGFAEGYSAASSGFDVTLAHIAERMDPHNSEAIKVLRYDLRHKNFP